MLEKIDKGSTDSVTWFLRSISREPLLTPAEEIELGNHVQKMMEILEDDEKKLCKENERYLRLGKRSKERMMKANLRLVVSIAKKYQGKGMELQDLIQEGTLGLERAVEKFDPTRGYKFSTYAFWWIRQSITRCIATQSRSIKLPVHLSERLIMIKRVTHVLSQKLGTVPSKQEIAEAMSMSCVELDNILSSTLSTFSLDEPVNAGDGKSYLGDLIADGSQEEPLDTIDRSMHKEQIDKWLSLLTEQEKQVISMRFGLESGTKITLSEIGDNLGVSRERVRQIEIRALRKLRGLSKKIQMRRV